MDFDQLLTQDAHQEGAEVQIVNPNTGEKTDVYIKVLGPDSKEFRASVKAALRKMIENDPSDDFETDIEQIAAVTVGWRGLMKDGKEMDFTKKACKELYRKSPRIFDQVNRFIGDYKNFTKG